MTSLRRCCLLLRGCRRGLVDLGLQTRLDDIEWTGDDSSETSSGAAREQFQRHADVAALLVYSCPGVELLPEHELQGRERKIAEEGSLVSVEHGSGALRLYDGAAGV